MRQIIVRVVTALGLLLLLLVLPFGHALAGPPNSWSNAASMAAARQAHTATLLNSGDVLVAGGLQKGLADTYLNSAEIFTLTKGSGWSSAPAMNTARANHTATRLIDGRVLVVGGRNNTDAALATAEIFDPAANGGAGAWTTLAATLATARQGHTATLLGGGMVLIVGGCDSTGNVVAVAEFFDPTANSGAGGFSSAGTLGTARAAHTATLAPFGYVWVVGGQDGSGAPLNSVEVYSSMYGWTTWTALNTPRAFHTTTLIDGSGTLLVAGGRDGAGDLASAEKYDVFNGVWVTTGTMGSPREQHTATPLDNGKVLVAGGSNGGASLNTSELYDPAAAGWTSVPDPIGTARTAYTATTLLNGKVLAAGGQTGSDTSPVTTSAAELYRPGNK